MGGAGEKRKVEVKTAESSDWLGCSQSGIALHHCCKEVMFLPLLCWDADGEGAFRVTVGQWGMSPPQVHCLSAGTVIYCGG